MVGFGASPARRGGAEMRPTQGSAVPTALQAAPTDRGGGRRAGEGGWASRTQGWAQLCPPRTPRWGVGGASCLRVPHTPPTGKGWRQRRVPPRQGPDHRGVSVSPEAPRPPALMAQAHMVLPNWVWQHRGVLGRHASPRQNPFLRDRTRLSEGLPASEGATQDRSQVSLPGCALRSLGTTRAAPPKPASAGEGVRCPP